jgi:hypothetical protein
MRLRAKRKAGLTAPIQTLNYVGIPIPETSVDPDALGGLGGNEFATGYFAIEELGLGSLAQKDLLGNYGILTADSCWNPEGSSRTGSFPTTFQGSTTRGRSTLMK